MARVYLAVHREVPSLKVILKVLKDPQHAERFRQEADKLALLEEDSRVCRIKGFFQWEGDLIIVMEFIDGVTVEDLIKSSGHLPVREAVLIAVETLDVLAFAHRKGIYHRDIKPSNIMRDKNGAVRIIDLGIAKAKTDPSLTAVGGCCGTPEYMAPEQFSASDDTRFDLTDIYAVGMTLYKCLTGTLPFAGGDLFAIRDAKLFQDPKSPHAFNREVSPALTAVVLKAIHRDPAKRYQTALEMKEALVSASGVTLPFRYATPTPPPPPPRKPARPGVKWAAAGVLVAAAVAAYLFFGRGQPSGPDTTAALEPPPVPVPAAPPDGGRLEAGAAVRLVWSSAGDSTVHYRVQIADNADFLNSATYENLSDTFRILDTSFAAEVMYWRVRAVSREGLASAYSAPGRFAVAAGPAATSGTLKVTANRPVRLKLDNAVVAQRVTSWDTVLAAGDYRLEANHPGAAPSTQQQPVRVVGGRTARVSFEFALPADSGVLFVGSDPVGNEIYLNGRPRGSTPQFFKLPVGEYRVQVKKGDVASSPEVGRIVQHGDTAWFMYDFTGDSVAVE